MKILLADDNHLVAFMTIEILKKLKYTVKRVEDGSECLNELKNNLYDLILMDIEMPLLNGIETSRLIREGAAGPEKKNIPILAMSAASATSFCKKSWFKAGIDGFLSKPLDILLLKNKITTILGSKNK